MTKQYDPNGLLDAAIAHMNVKNDAALARALKIAPPVLSKTRHARLPVGPGMILKLIENAGMELSVIRGFIPA